MTRLDEIPTAFEPPADARPSAVVERIRAIRPSRRAVLRGLVIGAAAAALVPLDWYLTRRAASAQEGSGDTSEHLSCTPESYAEVRSNWPAGTAICYGGYRRGVYPCSDGYHREGQYAGNGETYDSTRLTTSCHGRNAWRWNGYRCSDAMTLITFADGTEYNGVTIAACQLGGGEESATPPSSRDRDRGDGGGDTGRSRGRDSDADDDSSPSGDPGGDPSSPSRVFPDLGLGLRSLPGIGSLAGR